MTNVIYLLILPFLGTTIGAASVFFLKDKLNQSVQKMFLGFAAGVMVAASVWSLIIPAINQCEDMGKLAFIPASVGLVIGFAFLLLLDKIIPHLHVNSNSAEGPKSKLGKSIMLFLAVTLHNIPEGMAVGVTAAAMLSGESGIGMAAAFSLALGIAIQNFPEGAILSLPLKEELNKVEKADLVVTNNNIRENETITFVRDSNTDEGLLRATVPTIAVNKTLHWDVLLLIALFAATMIISQKIMMSMNKNDSMDPTQQALQKSMGTFMPLMIIATFVVIPIPAGVLLYLITSNIIQIAQTIIIDKQIKLEEENKKKYEISCSTIL